MFFVCVVCRVELCDDADCNCCMCNLSLDVVQENSNKVFFPKRDCSSLPKMNSDTCCSMLGGESGSRRDMGAGCSHSNFEKSPVKACWLMVESRWRVEDLALFVDNCSSPGSFAAVA